LKGIQAVIGSIPTVFTTSRPAHQYDEQVVILYRNPE